MGYWCFGHLNILKCILTSEINDSCSRWMSDFQGIGCSRLFHVSGICLMFRTYPLNRKRPARVSIAFPQHVVWDSQSTCVPSFQSIRFNESIYNNQIHFFLPGKKLYAMSTCTFFISCCSLSGTHLNRILQEPQPLGLTSWPYPLRIAIPIRFRF